jgi:antitoxin (DNA-binding transcriptional repressor) of toxin-antitoxin stability system
VIRRHNVPVAKLVPFRPRLEPRELGGLEGQIEIDESFDDLPADLAAAFRGEHP